MNKRAEMIKVNQEQRERIDDIRESFSMIYNDIEQYCNQSRETRLALTKLEEAQFWAIKGVTREEE